MKYNLTKKLEFYTLITFIIISSISAQTVSVNADFVSRYIWRGLDLGSHSPSIQPNFKFSIQNFNAGFWGAYSLSDKSALEEIDFYTSLTFNLGMSGDLSLGFTDYMNPNNGTKIGNFHNHNNTDGPGAHFIELNVNYYGPETFPISFSFNSFVHNVANNPVYFQSGYPVELEDVKLNLFVGGTTGEKSSYYGVTNFGLIHAGFLASKNIKVSETFSIALMTSVILNPASENLFYVFGFSF